MWIYIFEIIKKWTILMEGKELGSNRYGILCKNYVNIKRTIGKKI